MANLISVAITLGQGIPSSLVTAGNARTSLLNFSALLKKIASGSVPGTSTVEFTTGEAEATGTITAAAVAAADTVTINGTALTAEQQRATATATFDSLDADDTVTLNGVEFTAVAEVEDEEAEFALGDDDTDAAANLAALVNASADPLIAGLITATSALGVVTFRAVTAGTAGNALTLVSSNGTRAAVTGSGTLANGAAVANNKFDVSPGSTDTQVAADIVRAVNASSTALVSGQVVATSAAAVVTLTAKAQGASGNAITLVSSNGSRLAVSGSGRLTAGAETYTSFSL